MQILTKRRELASVWTTVSQQNHLCATQVRTDSSRFPYKPAGSGYEPQSFSLSYCHCTQDLAGAFFSCSSPCHIPALETPDLFLSLVRSSLTYVRDSITYVPSSQISSGHHIRRDQFIAFLSMLQIQTCSSGTL